MLLPGRHGAVDSYRYGFQGQEIDPEIKPNDDGTPNANSINYKFRMHDPRLGRFFAVDPLAVKYPHNSPYAFSENRLIDGVELEGLEYETIKHYINPYTKLEVRRSSEYHTNTEVDDWYVVGFLNGKRGIKHEYYDTEGNKYSEPIWDQLQDGYFSFNAKATHLYYSGSGCVTYTGYNDYDFSRSPRDTSDKIAKGHDLRYSEIPEYINFVSDIRSLEADLIMISELDKFINSPGFDNQKGETKNSAKDQIKFIGLLAKYKMLKKTYMFENDLDINDPNKIKDVTVDMVEKRFSKGTMAEYLFYFMMKSLDKEPEEKTRDWISLEEQFENKG
jgi:hypothetical protein